MLIFNVGTAAPIPTYLKDGSHRDLLEYCTLTTWRIYNKTGKPGQTMFSDMLASASILKDMTLLE